MNKLDSNNPKHFWKAIDALQEGIKKDYANWSSWSEGIERFNEGVKHKIGKNTLRYFKEILFGALSLMVMVF